MTSRRGTILDVGCGTGRLLQTTADRFPSSVLVGVDLSGAMPSVAGRDARLHCVQAAAERLPSAGGSFDLVMTNASFRHWVDQCQAMSEIGRVLKPTGVVGIADLFGPLRAGLIARWTRRVWLPAPLAMALDSASLVVLGADSSAGPGPLGGDPRLPWRTAVAKVCNSWTRQQ